MERGGIQCNKHEILLLQRQDTTKPFPNIMGRGKEKPIRLCPKHHPIWNHRTMRPRYVKATKKDMENSK